MSTDLYKNSGELLNRAQEAVLAPQGGFGTTFKENGRYYQPLSLESVVLQLLNSQWEVILSLMAIIC